MMLGLILISYGSCCSWTELQLFTKLFCHVKRESSHPMSRYCGEVLEELFATLTKYTKKNVKRFIKGASKYRNTRLLFIKLSKFTVQWTVQNWWLIWPATLFQETKTLTNNLKTICLFYRYYSAKYTRKLLIKIKKLLFWPEMAFFFTRTVFGSQGPS